MVALSELVVSLDAELQRRGYKDSTMVWYRGCWRRLQRYFAARGVEEFSPDLAMTWVDETCGFFVKERAGTLEEHDVYLFRVASMLDSYAVHGAVLHRYTRSVDKLTPADTRVLARFTASLRAAGQAPSTVRTYTTLAGEFLAFVGTRGALPRLDTRVLDAFVATLAGYQFKTVATAVVISLLDRTIRVLRLRSVADDADRQTGTGPRFDGFIDGSLYLMRGHALWADPHASHLDVPTR